MLSGIGLSGSDRDDKVSNPFMYPIGPKSGPIIILTLKEYIMKFTFIQIFSFGKARAPNISNFCCTVFAMKM